MEIFSQINDYYNKIFDFIPAQYRVIIAVVVIAVLAISIFKFLRRNFIWIIIVILLLPATWPALKLIWEKIISLASN